MERFKNYVWMAAGFVILAAAISAFVPGSALAQIVKAALVKNVDERGRVPYTSSASCFGPDLGFGADCNLTFTQVPANMRLVLEHITAEMRLGPGGKPWRCLAPGGYFAPTFVGTAPVGGAQPDYWALNQVILAYFEPGATPSAQVLTTKKVNIDMTIDGYLVALP